MKIDDFKITVTFETYLTSNTTSVIFTDADIAYSTHAEMSKLLQNALSKQELKKRNSDVPRS